MTVGEPPGAATYRLWSFQPVAALQQLRTGESFRTDPELVRIWDEPAVHGVAPSWGFSDAYEWMCEKLSARTPAPEPGMLPVWAWHTQDPRWPGRPDLRRYRASTAGVMLELHVPRSAVLLSDFITWHHVLNYWYAGRDWLRFEKDTIARGLRAWEYNQVPELRLQVVQSWERVLRVDPRRGPIQAVMWEIRPEWLRRWWLHKANPPRRLG